MNTLESDVEHRVPVPISALSDKHERFVQELMANGGNLSDAYRAVYPNAGDREAVWTSAARLRARSDVKARIAELTQVAAERALATPVKLLSELQEIVDTDMTELQRIVACACPSCWPDAEIVTAANAYHAAIARRETVTPPDYLRPRPGCPAHPRCHRALIVTPTDELSAAARRLIKGVRVRGDDIEYLTHDQMQMRIENHTLRRMRVNQSLSATVTVDPTKNPWSNAEQTPDEILARVMKSRRSREPVTTVEPDAAP